MIYPSNPKKTSLSKFLEKASDITALQQINIKNMKAGKKFFLLENIKMILLLKLIICN